MANRETADEIEAAAMAWIARLDRAGDTAAVQAELDAWLEADTRRQGAFLRAEAIWLRLDRATQQDALDPDVSDVARSAAARFRSRRWLIGGTAGLGAAASVAGGWMAFGEPRVETAVGEVRHVPLADGSSVDLNTASRVAVALQKARRTLRLDRGEAWFQVEKDPARPFVVEAGRVRVQAIGTAFSVRRYDRGAEVFVSEGVVSAWVDGRRDAAVRIEAGDKVFVTEAALTHQVVAAPAEIDRRLAWRAGKIDLEGETLAEAVAEFNRYNVRTLHISDPALASKRFYGVFRMDDPEGFAKSVHSSLNVQLTVSDGEIYIGG